MQLKRAMACGLSLWALTGCQAPPSAAPAPAGPAATTTADLTPWTAEARPARMEGTLQQLHIHSRNGSFVTWSLMPEGPHQGAEVDVRQCSGGVELLRGREVIVEGKLIDRADDHMPLLVAKRITPRYPLPRNTFAATRVDE